MTQSGSQVLRPMAAVIQFADSISASPCVIDRIDQYAGEAIGSAIVRFPATNANDVTRHMGLAATINIGNQIVFKGYIGHGPFEVHKDQDEIQLVLFDSKWRLSARKVATPYIGTVGDGGVEGFTDVGFETIFNRDAKPNKKPVSDGDEGLDFSLGAGATFWTLRDVLQFVFKFYVPTSLATVPPAQVEHEAWDRKPSNLNCVGMSVLQAVNILAQLAGESWSLIPSTDSCLYRSVHPGVGEVRPLRMFMPYTQAGVDGATEGTVSDINAALSIENVRDTFHVLSGDIVKESTYSIANGLIVAKGASPIAKYAKRFGVDVTKYNENALGRNRANGSRPKPWKRKLVTRLVTTETAQHYATADELIANPLLEGNEAVDIPVWISPDGQVENIRRMSGGYRIDTEHNFIDLAEKPEVLADEDRAKTKELRIESWDDIGLWITVATVLETCEIESSYAFMEDPIVEVVRRGDLVPERREKVILPKLTGSDPHALDTIAEEQEEKYVDVTARLNDALSALTDSSPEIESPITATLPMFPVWQIGDRVAIQGRPSGATGKEVITKITYNVYEEFSTVIEATNVMVAVDPEKFVGKQR